MAEQKTRATTVPVADYLAGITDPARRADCAALAALMEKASGAPATMWGPSIIGFGHYRYTYESGHSGEACLVGFAARKNDLSLYLSACAPGRAELLARLGKHKTGKGCVYIKRLADIDLDVLEQMVRLSIADTRARYPG